MHEHKGQISWRRVPAGCGLYLESMVGSTSSQWSTRARPLTVGRRLCRSPTPTTPQTRSNVRPHHLSVAYRQLQLELTNAYLNPRS